MGNRRNLVWISIILELSLILGIGFYSFTNSSSCVDEGGPAQLEEQNVPEEINLLALYQEREIIDKSSEENNPLSNGKGGPYVVAPFLHISIYRAKNGDNLWTIAKKNSLDWYTLLSVNHLDKANSISIGQKLKVPNQRGIMHRVNEGETLEDIALEYEANIRKIIRVNRILTPNEIKPNTDLFIPNAKITYAFSQELVKNSGIPMHFAWPCRRSTRVSSPFGYRRDPFTRKRAFHHGVDLAPGYGSTVYAAGSGIVTHAGWLGGYGKLIVIRHKNGYTTRYGHLSSILVLKGKHVTQGQRIGKVGSTGRSTGAHLHFEIRKSGKALNPLKLIR